MPQIPQYTRGIIKQRAVPNMVDLSEIDSAGQGARAAADIAGDAAKQIQVVQQKKQTRYETIQRARAVSGFQQEIENDFIKFETENDLTNPDAPKQFNQTLRKKMKDYVAQHEGGAESRTSLELQLTGMSDTYSMRVSEKARMAQKQFITSHVGKHIDRIVGEVYQNPGSIDMAFKQLNGLINEYSPALDSIDEMEQLETAQSMIVEGALNSFIDAGDYESAQELVNNNDRFIEAMPAKTQMTVLGRINNGLAAQEKESTELQRKMKAIGDAAAMSGVEISRNKIFSAATGISETQTPDQKVAEFAKVTGLTPEKMTPAIIAKIGFGVDLPAGGEIDMNKERLPDGGYTPKGIGAVIKTPYEDAANVKITVEKVILQADEYLNNENSQAGLAALISFQKLIDDGAMVREGDIKLSAQGNSAYDNLGLMLSKIEKGAIGTPRQMQQMKDSAEIFGRSVLEASKTYIDPYLQEGRERGYRMLDIGIPQSAYDSVFGNVKTSEDRNQRNSEIETKAKNHGMSVNEYLTATAKKRNMTVEQVAKKLGYTGSIQ